MGAVLSLPALSDVVDEVLFARLPDKRDPAALHVAGSGLLREAIGAARPLDEYLLEVELAKWTKVLDHLSRQVNAVRAVAPLVANLPADGVASEIARLAKIVNLDQQVVSHEVVAAVSRPKASRPRSKDLNIPIPRDPIHQTISRVGDFGGPVR